MLTPIIIYGGLAIAREALAVIYYKAITASSATLASAVNFLIELLDIFVLSTIVMSLIRNGTMIPMLAYAVFGSLGVFLGVKLKLRGNR